MTNDHRSQNLRVEDGVITVTNTTYDEDDNPIKGDTKTFTTLEEAEDYMAGNSDKSTNQVTTKGEDIISPPTSNNDQPITAENNVTQTDPVSEKPASEMTEADAVALNADAHVATPQTDTDRIVTEGEKDQVAAGLHPKPEAGNPEYESKS